MAPPVLSADPRTRPRPGPTRADEARAGPSGRSFSANSQMQASPWRDGTDDGRPAGGHPPGRGHRDDRRTPDPGGRRREEHHRPGHHGAAPPGCHRRGGPHRRDALRPVAELPSPPGGPRRDAARPRRLRCARAHGPGAAVGGHPRALPHRPRRSGRPAPGSGARGRRLHDQAVQRRGDAAADQRHPAPDRGIRGASARGWRSATSSSTRTATRSGGDRARSSSRPPSSGSCTT